MPKLESIDSTYIDELRECAWIAYKGYFCCLAAEDLVYSSIPSTFLVHQQQNAYMCSILWWCTLFGLDSPTYQYNRNFRRDFRFICNKKRKSIKEFSGENVDDRLMKAISMDPSQFAELRETVKKSRDNFFAHVNPDEQIYAFELNTCKSMFQVCIDMVLEMYKTIKQLHPELSENIERSENIIRDRMTKTKEDHAQFTNILTGTWDHTAKKDVRERKRCFLKFFNKWKK